MHTEIHEITYPAKTRALCLFFVSAILLSGCNLSPFQDACATLETSLNERENELLIEHEKLVDKIKGKYFSFGFKDQLGMAFMDVLVEPGEDLVQLSNQYNEIVEAMKAMGPDECEKKLELSNKRQSLYQEKLKMMRDVLEERTDVIIEKTKGKPFR